MADRATDMMRDRRRLGSLATNPALDRWISFEPNGTVVIRTGKAELGQGVHTALALIAADELGVDARCIVVQGAKSGVAPNEGVTAGSGSIEQSGSAIRQACAHARRILTARAADHLDVPVEDITIDDGAAHAASAGAAASVSLWDLAVGKPFAVEVDEPADVVPPSQHRWVGRGMPRLDLPAKIRGEPVFVHDLDLPGLLHARVVRPLRPGARLTNDPEPTVDGARVVRRGSFLAVVAEREADAVEAAESLSRAAQWGGGDGRAAGADAPDYLEAHVTASTHIVDGSAVADPPPPPFALGTERVVHARYSKPFIMHGSIGPSAAAALYEEGRLHIWSHSQGVELLRMTIAEALGLDPRAVSAEHVDGAGCYGHNGADDAALDAAIVALEHPAHAVLMKWTRADEHGWEPLSPAMSMRLSAELDTTGCITRWQHDVYSYSHGARPRPMGDDASGLLATWSFDPPRRRPEPQPSRGFHSGIHRNADPLYDVGDKRIVAHFVRDSPLRTSSTRGLGAFGNVFAIESFMDELAIAAGTNPIEFRLDHLHDERARAVLEAVDDLAGGLVAPGGLDAPGRGVAFARYENIKTYVALIAEVEVVARTGEIRLTKGWIVADAGQVIDPDGLVNQLEGGFVQAASWALKEQVLFGADGVTSRDWDSYPILRFSESPEVVTRLIDRPEHRSVGAGEATTGPTPAAIANAVFQATGARIRDLPMRPERVKTALASVLDTTA